LPRSLRFRILSFLAAVGLVSIVVVALIINHILVRQQRNRLDTRLSMISMMAHACLRNLMLNEHQNELREFILRFGENAPLVGLRLISPEGIVTISHQSEEEGKPYRAFDKVKFDGEWNHFIQKDDAGGPILTSLSPVRRQPSCIACHPGPPGIMSILNVDISAKEITGALALTQLLLIGSSLFMALLFVGTAFMVHFRFVKSSLHKIISGISQLEQGNFAARIDLEQKDELGRLAGHINRLGDRLAKMRRALDNSHQAELERAERMASVGELASSIAHEIKNPVAGIASAMEVLSAELLPGDEREVIFAEILNQTQRVNRAVNDLLSYARPSLPELALGSLNEPLRHALTLLEARRKGANVALEIRLDPHLPPALFDPQQMQQVFVNLIFNALQAMPSGGTLKIASGFENKELFACISDTGVGIPKEIMQDIFKPFFTTKHQGTGLGLSICRSIIENHHGKIEVYSTRGEGSTFKVILPGDRNLTEKHNLER